VTLDAGEFSNNQAVGGSTTVLCSAEQRGADASAGAVAASGVLTANTIRFASNRARGGSGMWGGGECSMSATNAGAAVGGAVYAKSGATFVGTTATQNMSFPGDPSRFCRSGGSCVSAPPATASGGAIHAEATLAVTGGAFSGNSSSLGRALYARAALSVDGGEYTGHSGSNGVLFGMLDVTVRSANIHDNFLPGIDAPGSGTSVHARENLTLANTLVRRSGGVVAGQSLSADSVTIADTLGTPINARNATLLNTTLSGNDGSILVQDRLELNHVTLVGGGVSAARLTSHRSVVLGDAEPVCATPLVVENAKYNWFSDASCALPGATNNQSRAGFFLGALGDNGGPVPTQLPAAASVLLNRVPSSACPVTVDARGVARPQGAACDIGAVEVAPVSAAATDMAVSFTNPPAPVAFGEVGTWQVSVRNKGPNPAAAGALIDVPAGVVIQSASATAGGVCTVGFGGRGTGAVSCLWNATPLAPGATATVTFVGAVDQLAPASLRWRAVVAAPQPAEPRSDDTATLTTPVLRLSGLTLRVGQSADDAQTWQRVMADVVNVGPSAAELDPARPIRVTFRPAAGVAAEGSLDAQIEFALQPGSSAAGLSFELKRTGSSWPSVLGTFVLDPGPNQLAGSGTIPLVRTDLGLRVERGTAVQPPGTPTMVRFTVTNHGPNAARNTELSMQGSSNIPAITWTTDTGTLAPSGSAYPVWKIPSLGVGQSAVLSGSVPFIAPETVGARLGASVRSEAMEIAPDSESVVVDLTGAQFGTADLQITGIDVRPGSSAGTRIARVNIRNAGPAAALADDTFRMNLSLQRPGGWQQLDVRALSPGWSCTMTSLGPYCFSATPMPAGETASVEFVVQEPVFEGRFHALLQATSLAPDPNLANNDLSVTVP
jgi:uncharacterized repeat protein (TIGR01451 family)